MDLAKINETLQGLPRAALSLAPNDPTLNYIVRSIPPAVTKENAKETMIGLGLLTRRLAIIFNDLAAEQEKLVQEWED